MTANPTMDAHVTKYMEHLLEALSGPSVTKETIALMMTDELYKVLSAYQKQVIQECVTQYQERVDSISAAKDRLIAEARAERDIANTIAVKMQTDLLMMRQKLKAPKQRLKMATGRGRKRA